jgi:peptidoglycan/xylan/chitin deacetylase (PgdA/CDA1 family)
MPRRRRSPVLALAVGALLVACVAVAAGLAAARRDERTAAHRNVRAVAPTSQPSSRGAAPRSPSPTVAAADRSVLRGRAARNVAVPILMFHVLGTPGASAPLPELWVSKTRFREQLAALSAAGFQAVTLKAVVDGWAHGGPLPRRPVVLTFDDGYLSHATVAAPAMRRYGWPGVVNVTLHNLGADGLPRHLAQTMARSGWEFDSHTMTHPDLRTIDDARLTSELRESRRAIRSTFGVTPRFFCYPAGKFDARVVAAVRAAGYDAATTVQPGIARRTDDPYALPRVRVTNADDGDTLVARLTGQ